MPEWNDSPRLADRLRDHDPDLWRRVEEDVMPRVVEALRRRFGAGRRWHDLEGFARSAQRVACQRLAGGDYAPLEELETLAELEKWLVRVAAHKFYDALDRAACEAAHAARIHLLRDRARLDALAGQSAAAVVEELEASLKDEAERAVFRGKLDEKPEFEIARELRCTTTRVRSLWRRIRRRLARVA